ncbi:MAG: hypothetical protein Q9212_006494, partial [Teloschistes hypoglaucus]
MGNSKKQNNPGNPTTSKKDNKPEKLTDSMSQEECLQFLDDHYGPTLESLTRSQNVICYVGAAKAIVGASRKDYHELLRAWVLRVPGFSPYERYKLSIEDGVDDLLTLDELSTDLMRHPEESEHVAKLSEVAKNPDLASKGFTSAVKRRVVPTVQEDKDTVDAPSDAESPAIKSPAVQSPGIAAAIVKTPATDIQTPSKAPLVKAPTVQGQSENAPPSHDIKATTPSPLPQRKSPLETPHPSPSVTPKSWRKVSLPHTKRGVQIPRKTPTSPTSPHQQTAENNAILTAGIARIQQLERLLAEERSKCQQLEAAAKAIQRKADETQQNYSLALASASEANRKHLKAQKAHEALTALLQQICSYLSKLEKSPYAAEILPADHLATIVELDKAFTEFDIATLPRLPAPTLDSEIHNMNIAFGLAALVFIVPVQWHLKLRHDAASLGELDD